MPEAKPEFAKVLYKTLHDLDRKNLSAILFEIPPLSQKSGLMLMTDYSEQATRGNWQSVGPSYPDYHSSPIYHHESN
jgi:hypothetical protein